MELKVDRKYKKGTYTISNLFIDGDWVCNIIEDKDRGLHKGMSLAQIRSLKVKSKTAIPSGRYRVTMKVVSPKFSLKKYYMDFCKGRLPRVLAVPGFDGILFHAGDLKTDVATAGMSAGCLLTGLNTIKGALTKTKEMFEYVCKILMAADERGEEIWVTVGAPL
ncbi:MAG: hypothetical protein IKR31_03275 [Prevotella sp.]|nr:hypothetical protein [Prevotella sp.]